MYERYLKRALDFAVSLIGLILLSPLLAAIAWVIKREDQGDVFYRGWRVGKNGKLFRIYKFRTMVMDADKMGGPSTAADDPRITRVGRFLRKYKLDELPQLINVMKGEMSLVGPRPEVPEEVERYDQRERSVLRVRPGLTDWASIKFRNEGEILRGSPDPHQTYREKIKPEKMELALKYLDELSFKTDMKIIFQTIIEIFR